MTKKIALTGLCALFLVANIGCSTTKTAAAPATTKSSNDAKTAQTDQKLPAVGEPPQDTAPHRAPWGSNISPYF